MYKPLLDLPVVSRDPQDILRLFGPESEQIQSVARTVLKTTRPVLGCDLEYREPEKYREEPTVLGVSDGALSVSVPFDEGLPYFQQLAKQNPDIMYVGHAFTSADKFAFRQVGIEIETEAIEDTIIRFYLTNAHLCKTGAKVEDGDGEKRGKGYMNLWAFLSIYTDFFNYKDMFDQGIPYKGEKLDVWQYNGMDSLGPVLALPQVVTQSRLRGVDKLYPLHRDLAYVLGEMTRYGVQIDRPYVEQLQRDFETAKTSIEEQLPFNPKSNKAALEHFRKKEIVLADWTEKTIREAVEEHDDEELALCLDYKELGNGTDRWFAPVSKNKSGEWEGYMDERGKIHPRLGMFTSTGRLQCTSPNLQNVAKRRVDRHVCECGLRKEEHTPASDHEFKGASLGKMVRRAIIATPGHYLLKADYSNAENRVFLFLGGHHIPNEIDLHLRVSDIARLTPEMEFSISLGGPREAAKSIQHAGNYLEGLQLKYPKELKSGRIPAEIAAGARLVFPDWTFNGKVVTFTGANLARRAFGDASWANRAKALDVASKYFGGFPGARDLQRKITKQAETQKAIITPHGYYLLSFGDDEERCKTGAAMWGSNPVAHFTKIALVDLWTKFLAGRPLRPVLQVHDEIICEVPEHVDPQVAAGWLRESMEIETPEIPGLVLPIGNPSKGELASWGANWRDTRAIKV